VQTWSAIPRGQPLFESLLVFENYPMEATTVQESQLRIVEAQMVERTNYPLTVTVVPGSRLALRLSYQRERFEPEQIERLAGHLQTLLEGMAEHPEQRLATLPWLTAAEQAQLLSWNSLPPTERSNERTLAGCFAEQVARTPDAVALVYGEEQLTYAELQARASQLARYLQQMGVGPEVRVGLCLERSLSLVLAVLAIVQAGGTYVPLDPDAPTERLAFVLTDAQARVVVTQQAVSARLPATGISCFVLDAPWPTVAESDSSEATLPGLADATAYVIYTSGSTGQPKGVLVSHRQVTRLLTSTEALVQPQARDCWTLFHSIAFDFSVWELWGALLWGARLVVVPYWQSRSSEVFLGLLVEQQVSVLNQTPSAFRLLEQTERSQPPQAELALRLVIFGGEALDPLSVRFWWERHGEQEPQLVNMYGITETTVHVTAHPLQANNLPDLPGSGTPIGRPLRDLQGYVLDPWGQLVPPGVVGELYVGGAGVVRGYLGQPALTAERFVPHPWSEVPGARLYRSGDLVRYRGDGRLEYVGRNDQQVKIRGYRIELGEIEAALRGHSEVREAVVVVRDEEQGSPDRRLVAYVVAQPDTGEALSPATLRAFLKDRLPAYMVPASFYPLEELPLTSNGKLDRQALPLPQPGQFQTEQESEYLAPRTPTEETLATIWTQVLHQEKVGVHGNFFELGGHSLLATQIIVRIREAFQVDLPLHTLFLTPTVADIAKEIEELKQQTTREPRIPTIKRLSRSPR
jgi:amino acid adenylation domain-containing protein